MFVHKHGKEKLRRLPESNVIDVTYKTNIHRMTLLNFVIVGTVAYKRNRKQPATICFIGHWMRNKTADSYQCAMSQLNLIIWTSGTDASLLPNNFVTDNDKALMNAIENIFPESKHILWVLQKQKSGKSIALCQACCV